MLINWKTPPSLLSEHSRPQNSVSRNLISSHCVLDSGHVDHMLFCEHTILLTQLHTLDHTVLPCGRIFSLSLEKALLSVLLRCHPSITPYLQPSSQAVTGGVQHLHFPTLSHCTSYTRAEFSCVTTRPTASSFVFPLVWNLPEIEAIFFFFLYFYFCGLEALCLAHGEIP